MYILFCFQKYLLLLDKKSTVYLFHLENVLFSKWTIYVFRMLHLGNIKMELVL